MYTGSGVMNACNSTQCNSSADYVYSGLPPNLTCREDFLAYGGRCLAKCEVWSQLPHNLLDAVLITQTTSVIVGSVAAIVCLAIGFYEYKKM